MNGKRGKFCHCVHCLPQGHVLLIIVMMVALLLVLALLQYHCKLRISCTAQWKQEDCPRRAQVSVRQVQRVNALPQKRVEQWGRLINLHEQLFSRTKVDKMERQSSHHKRCMVPFLERMFCPCRREKEVLCWQKEPKGYNKNRQQLWLLYNHRKHICSTQQSDFMERQNTGHFHWSGTFWHRPQW